ncbi:MAG: polysaccharide biosynthesis tyrosine autokinase [Rivularia sp. (in: cyanobacteria)]|jgi:capsular exopolysaccharide synthesis family protein
MQTSLSPHVNPAADSEPGYGQLFAVLIRRFPWFLIVFLASVGGGYYVYQRTPPSYKSYINFLVEPNYQGEGTGQDKNQFTDSNVKIDIDTQLKLMKKSSLIKQAVEKLKPEYPQITVKDIKGSLSLDQLRSEDDDAATKIVQVEYTAKDPQQTQRVLEAIREVYLDFNKEQQKKRLRDGLRVIREQKKKETDKLNLAESQLLRFRNSQGGLTDPQTQAQANENALNNIQQERRTTHNQYKEAQARLNSLQEQLKRTPQNALVSSRLSQSTRYQGLLNEIQTTELAIAQANLRFTAEHPDVKKLKEQLAEQKQLLQQEVGRALGGSNIGASNVNSGELLNQGQLSQTDLNLASSLVETQTNLLALRARDQSLAQNEQLLQQELRKFPRLLAEYNRLQPQVERSRNRLQELLTAEQEVEQELDKGGFNWEVVEEPQQGDRLGPNLQQNLLLGGVVGLMLGGIAAFAREAGDDAVRTTAEIEKQFAIPLLGTTPKLPAAKTKESIFKLPFGKPEVLAPWTIQVLQSPPRWESLDLIYKNIELLNSVSAFKSLMITSALPDEGKSALALGLAMSAARLHKKVLLIDANLRDPSVHKHLNLPNEQGLSTLLTSDVALPSQITLQSSGSSYIDILTAGPVPEDPANLLSSPRMEDLMSAFEESYDLVILDASAVLGLVDALLTASTCRGVIMVASIGGVTRTQLAQATAMMGKLNLLGVVANGVSKTGYSYVPNVKQQQLALKGAVEE